MLDFSPSIEPPIQFKDEIRTKKVFVLLPGQLDAIRRDISIEWADVEKEEVHP